MTTPLASSRRRKRHVPWLIAGGGVLAFSVIATVAVVVFFAQPSPWTSTRANEIVPLLNNGAEDRLVEANGAQSLDQRRDTFLEPQDLLSSLAEECGWIDSIGSLVNGFNATDALESNDYSVGFEITFPSTDAEQFEGAIARVVDGDIREVHNPDTAGRYFDDLRHQAEACSDYSPEDSIWGTADSGVSLTDLGNAEQVDWIGAGEQVYEYLKVVTPLDPADAPTTWLIATAITENAVMSLAVEIRTGPTADEASNDAARQALQDAITVFLIFY